VLDAASRSTCVDLDSVQVREALGAQAGMSGVFVRATTCDGTPLVDLRSSQWVVSSDRGELRGDAFAETTSDFAREAVVSLLVDHTVRSAPYRLQIDAALAQLVRRFERLPFRVQMRLAFVHRTGEASAFTLDPRRLEEQLPLFGWEPESRWVTGQLSWLARSAAAHVTTVRESNAEGTFVQSHIVLLGTGDYDLEHPTAVALPQVLRSASAELDVVGLRNLVTEAQEQTWRTVASGNLVLAESPNALSRAADAVADRLAARFASTYLTRACAPNATRLRLRLGEGYVTRRTADAELSSPAATCPSPGARACGEAECGKLGCGGCDWRTSHCEGTRCINFCDDGPTCDGTIRNRFGYDQACLETATRTRCDGRCVDLQRDIHNCGACDSPCGSYRATCGGTPARCSCVNGPCPMRLAAMPDLLVHAPVLLGPHIYVPTSNNLLRVPRTGGAPVTVRTGGGKAVVLGGELYVLGDPVARYRPGLDVWDTLPSIGKPVSTLARVGADYLAADGASLVRWSGSGGPPNVEFVAPSPIRALAASNQTLIIATDHQILRRPLSGGPTSVLYAEPLTDASRLVSSDTHVAWSVAFGKVMIAPIDTGSPTELQASFADAILSVEPAAAVVFSQGDILRVTATSRQLVEAKVISNQPAGIADTSFVYWAGGRHLWRAPIPPAP
jgi:hypothetical protein